MLTVREVRAASAAATELIAELDADIARRYPGEPVHGIDVASFERDGGLFFIGFDGERAVACGALRPLGADLEVKRMFVRPDARGRGFARQMLATLEDVARGRGHERVVLETGSEQPEAVALYASSGYRPIPAYGDFVENRYSRCFEKPLRL